MVHLVVPLEQCFERMRQRLIQIDSDGLALRFTEYHGHWWDSEWGPGKESTVLSGTRKRNLFLHLNITYNMPSEFGARGETGMASMHATLVCAPMRTSLFPNQFITQLLTDDLPT